MAALKSAFLPTLVAAKKGIPASPNTQRTTNLVRLISQADRSCGRRLINIPVHGGQAAEAAEKRVADGMSPHQALELIGNIAEGAYQGNYRARQLCTERGQHDKTKGLIAAADRYRCDARCCAAQGGVNGL